jgi:hypothetical protein
MMAALLDKIRKARETRVEVGGYTFTVRRPTDVEMIGLRGRGIGSLLPFVVGWDGVRELDIINGGDPHPLAFDADVCAEWLSDRADLFGPLVKAVQEAYDRHAGELEAAAKN